MVVKSGIYCICNLINGKIYIGSTIDFEARWHEHKRQLNKGSHHSLHLQNAWNKYGEGNFYFGVLEDVIDKCELITVEQRWIDELHPEYNICPTAGNTRGREVLEKTRQKISKSNKGKLLGEKNPMYGRTGEKHPMYGCTGEKNPMYGRTGESSPNFGKPRPEETKRRISKSNKGKLLGENHPLFGRTGKDSPNYGKHRTEEYKRKRSESLMGKNNPMWGRTGVKSPCYKRAKCWSYNGKSQPLSDWSREYNIDQTTLASRVKKLGWSLERALLTPVKK